MPTIYCVQLRLCCAFFVLWLLAQGSKGSFKAGKANVITVSPGLFACQQVSFATPFHGGQEVTVLASLGCSIKSPTRGNGGAIWVESVDQSGFKACILEYSDGSNNTAEVNWIATQSASSGGKRGSISLGDWATGTQCKIINFRQPFQSPPVILVTPSHQTLERPQDAMAVWIEDSRKDSFKICLKESKIFDGVHKNIKVNWMAYTEANFDIFTLTESLVFTNNTQQDNYAFCQKVNFTSPFFVPPVVVLTPKRIYRNVTSQGSECDAMTAWVEYTSRNDMEICIKNYKSDENIRSILLTVDYLVIGGCHPVGVADPNRIPNAQMTASSYYSTRYYPYYGRLNEARGAGGWCPTTLQGPRTDYLQVDLGTEHSVCAVATQGASNIDERTTSYILRMSRNGVTWNTYKENNVEKVFQGNTDRNTIVKHALSTAVKARFVRFYYVTYHSWPAIRVEIYKYA